jgi:nitroimidazol reductase NimA-like FMN-containing flavoprotein (pyridoxamine 5'-phosphate oxidase superfamily)
MGEAQAETARRLIDEGRYMTLATADGEGRPWASPVWYAHDGYRDFVWVSKPDARHSANLADRQEAAIVIFDSHRVPGETEAVYVEAKAAEVADGDLDAGIEIFSRRSEAQGLAAWTRDDVTGGAAHRLYRAVASAQYLLGENDRRVPVAPWE